jgi:hypothetical protein
MRLRLRLRPHGDVFPARLGWLPFSSVQVALRRIIRHSCFLPAPSEFNAVCWPGQLLSGPIDSESAHDDSQRCARIRSGHHHRKVNSVLRLNKDFFPTAFGRPNTLKPSWLRWRSFRMTARHLPRLPRGDVSTEASHMTAAKQQQLVSRGSSRQCGKCPKKTRVRELLLIDCLQTRRSDCRKSRSFNDRSVENKIENIHLILTIRLLCQITVGRYFRMI